MNSNQDGEIYRGRNWWRSCYSWEYRVMNMDIKEYKVYRRWINKHYKELKTIRDWSEWADKWDQYYVDQS